MLRLMATASVVCVILQQRQYSALAKPRYDRKSAVVKSRWISALRISLVGAGVDRTDQGEPQPDGGTDPGSVGTRLTGARRPARVT
jgi:hypothetical protein